MHNLDPEIGKTVKTVEKKTSRVIEKTKNNKKFKEDHL